MTILALQARRRRDGAGLGRAGARLANKGREGEDGRGEKGNRLAGLLCPFPGDARTMCADNQNSISLLTLSTLAVLLSGSF